MLASGTPALVREMTGRILASTLLPAAVTVINARAAATLTVGYNDMLSVWIEGFTEAVDRHLNDLRGMATDVGMSADVLEGTAHRTLWERIRDFGSGTSGTLYRLTVPFGAVGDTVGTMSGWFPEAQIVAHAGAGTIWILSESNDAPGWFPRLSALAATARGHAIIAAASRSVKAGVDVWGPPPPGLAIMREIKRQFDPEGILNPGRFVAHL